MKGTTMTDDRVTITMSGGTTREVDEAWIDTSGTTTAADIAQAVCDHTHKEKAPMSDNRVTVTLTDGTTREVHPQTPVSVPGDADYWHAEEVDEHTDQLVATIYEPTREHWTPYGHWMRDVLADDARVSWVEGGLESRGTWRLFASAPDIYPDEDHAEFEMRVHPDDVPERHAEDDPDEAMAKVLLTHIAGTRGMTWDNTGLRGEYRAAARAAREHIEDSLKVYYRDLYERAEAELADEHDRHDATLLERERLLTALADMTRQRDESKARHAALRADVERLSNSWEDFDEPAPWRSPSYFAALNRCAYEARALLNPPTEGGESDADA